MEKHLQKDIPLQRFAQGIMDRLDYPFHIDIFWNSRLRTTAGLAYQSRLEKRIYLNPALKKFSGAEIHKTLRHELAHLLAASRYLRRRIQAHGKEWRQACADLGIPDESSRHSLPLARNKVNRKFVYVCPECDAKIARVRPIKKRAACMACCKTFNGGRYHESFRLRLQKV